MFPDPQTAIAERQVLELLRKRKEQAADDLLEYNWGFEEPDRIRKYTDPQHKHWDQIDVRMYFFDKAMKKTKWASAADGMWYIQDYVDFMAMLQKLDLPTDTFALPRSVSCSTWGGRREA